MKKLNLFILCLIFICPLAYADNWSGGGELPTPILSGHTVYASGTCSFIIDLKYYKIKEGDFSIQLSGVTCGWEDPATGIIQYLSGNTINARCWSTNDLGSGVTHTGLMMGTDYIIDNLEGVTPFYNLNIQSGLTRYIYDFFPDKARYLILDVIAGATSVVTSVFFDGD